MNFSFNWNNFITHLIYLNDSNLFPIALGLRLFETQMGGGDTYVRLGPLMAMTLVSIIPFMVAFSVAQRYFIQGIVFTGTKGSVVAALTSAALAVIESPGIGSPVVLRLPGRVRAGARSAPSGLAGRGHPGAWRRAGLEAHSLRAAMKGGVAGESPRTREGRRPDRPELQGLGARG